MSQHWNIQINIQRVETVDLPTTDKARGFSQALTGEKRSTLEVLKLAVTAETEVEAYDKVQRMLSANHPDTSGVTVVPRRDSRLIRDRPQA